MIDLQKLQEEIEKDLEEFRSNMDKLQKYGEEIEGIKKDLERFKRQGFEGEDGILKKIEKKVERLEKKVTVCEEEQKKLRHFCEFIVLFLFFILFGLFFWR